MWNSRQPRHSWFEALKPGVSDSQLALGSAWHQVRNLPETHLLPSGSNQNQVVPLCELAFLNLRVQMLTPPQMNLIDSPSWQQLSNLFKTKFYKNKIISSHSACLDPGDEFSLSQLFDSSAQLFVFSQCPALSVLVQDALVVHEVLEHGTPTSKFSTDGNPVLIVVLFSNFLQM